MTKLEQTTTWETKSDLVVTMKSENSPFSVIGWEKESTDLKVKFEIENPETDINMEDILQTEYNKEKNELDITIDLPKFRGRNRISFVLYVPALSEIIAKTENGPISIKKLNGIQTITTENGPISASGIKGDMVIKSENGPVSLREISGDLKITLENGPLKIIESDGNISIIEENGPVKIINCCGELELKSENGSVKVLKAGFTKSSILTEKGAIYYEFLPIEEGNFDFKIDLGRVNLVIPDQLEFDLNGRTRLGLFKISLAGEYESREEEGVKILQMIKGSGKVDINVETSNGTIVLSNHPIANKGFSNRKDFENIIGDVMDFIPNDKREIVRRNMEKIKEKIGKISLHDIEDKIEKSMNKVEKTINSELTKESNKAAFEKMKSNLHRAAENVHSTFESNKENKNSSNRAKEENRLKILQMLEDGKINAEEAEKLLKAMEL